MTAQAKLAGPLLIMVLVSGLIVLVGASGVLFAGHRLAELGTRYTIAVLFMTGWSALFVVMTLLRLRMTPYVTCLALVVWIAYRGAVALVSGNWPLMIDLLGEAVLTAGFCGYMASGSLPIAYYRRRLPSD